MSNLTLEWGIMCLKKERKCRYFQFYPCALWLAKQNQRCNLLDHSQTRGLPLILAVCQSNFINISATKIFT